MAITKEFLCAGHGPFEGTEPICPSGCRGAFVTQEFRTAPGYLSRKTKFADGTLRSIANDYGLTDMNNRDGESVMSRQRKGPQEAQPQWASNQIQHAQPGFSQRGEQAPTVNFGSLGLSKAPGDSFVNGVAKNMPSPRAFAHIEHKPFRPKKGMALLAKLNEKKAGK